MQDNLNGYPRPAPRPKIYRSHSNDIADAIGSIAGGIAIAIGCTLVFRCFAGG